ncbi:hypothetical protein [Raoultella planticola]|uniref:hypothetical protein n=1 Tax=Raoultella planticola TaxID=575 RepID=UPI0034E45404
MVNKYAVIEDGVVVNLIVWDGKSTLPQEISEPVAATDGVRIGWGYNGSDFYSPPEPEKTQDEISLLNLATAQSEYDKATAKINSLNERIQDTDFNDVTESAVRSSLAEWTNYRKELRSYLTSDGLNSLQTPPDDIN